MWKIAAEVGLKKDLTCYTFRHSVAMHMLRNEANVMFIAKLLGHASLKTTQRYLRVEIGDLKRVHSLYHPRERTSRGDGFFGGPNRSAHDSAWARAPVERDQTSPLPTQTGSPQPRMCAASGLATLPSPW